MEVCRAHLCVMPHAQATDLPIEIWSIIMQNMPSKGWRRARGFSRATNALRWPVVAAQMRTFFDIHGRVCVRELQLDRWSACHSLYLDLGQPLSGTMA